MGDVVLAIALAKELQTLGVRADLIGRYRSTEKLVNQGGLPFHRFQSAKDEIKTLKNLKPDVLIINTIFNKAAYVKTLKKLTSFLVLMDNLENGTDHADLNINVLYPTKNSLSDFKFICLRNEFQKFRKRSRKINSTVKKILIMQGAADTYGFIPKIVEGALRVRGAYRYQVVLGAEFAHQRELRQVLKQDKDNRVEVFHNVEEIAELMYEADLAITAAGISLFEVACLGTPSIAVCGEPFEAQTSQRLAKEGCTTDLGFSKEIRAGKIAKAMIAMIADPQSRVKMSRKGQKAIDGCGSARIANLLVREGLKRCPR